MKVNKKKPVTENHRPDCLTTKFFLRRGMYKRIIAQAGMKGKRQMRSCTPGTQDAAMSMDYPPIDEAESTII